MRPSLTKELAVDLFKDYYWLKQELESFCRENGLSASGSKGELSDRIEIFLRTGKIKRPAKRAKRNPASHTPLNLDTVISESHRCSQTVRAFFQTQIPNFQFSTHIQDFFKSNAGKTYGDAVNAWYEEEERKKDPSYKRSIAPQFEYNQFIRDFFADSNNKGKSREEAINAWKSIKKLPGSNTYSPI
ncbi:cytoplasmic protein [Bacillus salacetis]|uniref:Cytoplasmic protein n=1 Tax=Bacillus salacetis TaxID=2315464 RepID=A0A3A1QPJ0_9BACI|nr:DUF6434 domain-containing protein [Bacillus salacetis]RIW28955.1 cytoplasmic protein [Bacillus salacetis]